MDPRICEDNRDGKRMFSRDIKYLILIVVIFLAACIETDIYLPAFPDMMIFFKTSEKTIQSLLTWNFFGICISGPFYGPIADSFGRRKPLLIALGLFFIGSIITIFAVDFDWMLVGRLFQGLGSGGCFTLGTAILFDAFPEKKAVAVIAQLNVVIPVTMAFAPMVGGYLNLVYGFRANFVAIAAFVLVSLIMCLTMLDETHPVESRHPFKAKSIARDFGRAFSSLAFWQVIGIISLLFAGYLAFVSSTAVLYVQEFGISKLWIPAFQGAVLGAYVLASLLCSRSVSRWGAQKVKRIGVWFVTGGGILFAVAAFIFPTNPYAQTFGMLFYAYGVSWVMTPYFSESMEILPDIKGVASSLLTSFRLLITAVIVGAVAIFYDATVFPLCYMVLGILFVTIPMILSYEKSKLKVLT